MLITVDDLLLTSIQSSTHCRACYQNSSACSGRGTSGKGDSPPRSEERGTLRLPSFCQRSPHPTPSFPLSHRRLHTRRRRAVRSGGKESGLEAALARSTAARHNRLLHSQGSSTKAMRLSLSSAPNLLGVSSSAITEPWNICPSVSFLYSYEIHRVSGDSILFKQLLLQRLSLIANTHPTPSPSYCAHSQ